MIEGEAMLVVSELMNYDFLAHAHPSPNGKISDELFEQVFLDGADLEFIQALWDTNGWEALSAVFQDPPVNLIHRWMMALNSPEAAPKLMESVATVIFQH